ncbi:MAG: RNA polymerase-binding protein DksA [Deltaproteobacteria bacterium]|nr:RNA polymerase-binding protein DksA [Deltaproteobacteria bacterium]
MNKSQLEFFRKLLEQRRAALENGAADTVVEMTDDDETFPDPNDRATLESDRNFTLRIRDRERKLISKIDKAMQRIEDGSFGICEECGCEISTRRLEARPVTTLCIECKEEQERKEKARKA